MPNKNYYAILNVTPDATPAQIKTNYRSLALKLHPDKNKPEDNFDFTFTELQQAYETLSDPEKRRAYDSIPSEWLPNISADDPMLKIFLDFNATLREMGFTVRFENNKIHYEKKDTYFAFDLDKQIATIRYKDYSLEFKNANDIYYYLAKLLLIATLKMIWRNKYPIVSAVTTTCICALGSNKVTGRGLSSSGIFFSGVAGLVLHRKISNKVLGNYATSGIGFKTFYRFAP